MRSGSSHRSPLSPLLSIGVAAAWKKNKKKKDTKGFEMHFTESSCFVTDISLVGTVEGCGEVETVEGREESEAAVASDSQ